ncbi:MAG: SGNH/GDSL hydrolase family protein [Thermodesulfobacteriota bacterium]
MQKCIPPTPRELVCAPGAKRVDEIATRLFNTVLERGCGRFVIHTFGGNATFDRPDFDGAFIDPFGERHDGQVPVEPDLPRNDDSPGPGADLVPDGPRFRVDGGSEQAWVLALVGCGLGAIDRVEVSGGGVATARVDETAITSWLVPLSPASERAGPRLPGLGARAPKADKAFFRFDATRAAQPATDRTITVRWNDGSTQVLKQTLVTVARNGSGRAVAPASLRWEEETSVRFTGTRLGNPAFDGPACVEDARVVSSSETALEIATTMFCPRVVVDPETGERATVNAPECRCTPTVYDRLLSIYHELPKHPFAYFGANGVAVTPNLDYLASRPGLIGDSLSHGFYGGALKPQAQLWAYPHLVAAQMGSEGMSQNMVRLGPGLEDAIKSFLEGEYGPPPDRVIVGGEDDNTEQREVVGLVQDGQFVIGGQTDTPSHAGAAGMDYTNVLRTSGRCLDESATAADPVATFPVAPGDEPDESKNLCSCPSGPEPVLEMQLALACGAKTPIEIMEEVRPTFVFASAAGNHFLSCAVHTKARDCIEMERFFRDSSETFRRLRRIDSIRGGIVFGVPPLALLPWLDRQSVSPSGLRAFFKRDGEADTAGEVLDGDEEAFLTARIAEANAHLRALAELNGYAYVDADTTFRSIQEDGVPIVDPASGETICRATTVIPTETLDRDGALLGHNAGDDAGCGIFSLDGIHPNELGHAVMANEIIAGINEAYGLDVPQLAADEIFAAWQRDSLNQDPVDIAAFTHEVVDLGCVATLALELGALGITAPVCAATTSLCLESVALLGATAVTGSGCAVEVLLRELAIRPALDAIVRQPAPAFCWGGPEDRGECRFRNADGERVVAP